MPKLTADQLLTQLSDIALHAGAEAAQADADEPNSDITAIHLLTSSVDGEVLPVVAPSAEVPADAAFCGSIFSSRSDLMVAGELLADSTPFTDACASLLTPRLPPLTRSQAPIPEFDLSVDLALQHIYSSASLPATCALAFSGFGESALDTGYMVVPTADGTANDSMALTRKPQAGGASSTMGTTTSKPFQPGGLDLSGRLGARAYQAIEALDSLAGVASVADLYSKIPAFTGPAGLSLTGLEVADAGVALPTELVQELRQAAAPGAPEAAVDLGLSFAQLHEAALERLRVQASPSTLVSSLPGISGTRMADAGESFSWLVDSSEGAGALAPAAPASDVPFDPLDDLMANVPELAPSAIAKPVAKDTPQDQYQWAIQDDITKAMGSLEELIPSPARRFPFELDNFQKQAILRMEQDQNVFVAAHTSAGKTAVAEYAISMAERTRTRAIYTSPIKALSNQKFRDFSKIFSSVGLMTGDIQIEREAFCMIMTTEILRSMLYQGSDLIRDVKWVIFDEVHYVNDPERGVVWEEVLMLLPADVRILMLSATVPNALQFANWVGRIKQRQVYVVSTSHRPVPLDFRMAITPSFGPQKNQSQFFTFFASGQKDLNDRAIQAAERFLIDGDSGGSSSGPGPSGGGGGGSGSGPAGAPGRGSQPARGRGGRGGSAAASAPGRGGGQSGGGGGGRGGPAAAPGRGGQSGGPGGRGGGQSGGPAGRGGGGGGRGGRGGGSGGGGGGRGGSSFAQMMNIDYSGLVNTLNKESQLPAVIFTFSKKRCDHYAQRLVDQGSGKGRVQLLDNIQRTKIHSIIRHSLSRLNESDRMLPQVTIVSSLLANGIGVHHSGLLPIVKEMVEILFSDGLVKVLFATETFAMGVNMPARTVIFSSLDKPDGTRDASGKMIHRLLTPGEFIQMAGRAGRRGLDSAGNVLIPVWHKMPSLVELREIMLRPPTQLISQFRLTYMMVLSVHRVEELIIEDLLSRSFNQQAQAEEAITRSQEIATCKEDIARLLGSEAFTCSQCKGDLEALAQCVLRKDHAAERMQLMRLEDPLACPPWRLALVQLTGVSFLSRRTGAPITLDQPEAGACSVRGDQVLVLLQHRLREGGRDSNVFGGYFLRSPDGLGTQETPCHIHGMAITMVTTQELEVRRAAAAFPCCFALLAPPAFEPASLLSNLDYMRDKAALEEDESVFQASSCPLLDDHLNTGMEVAYLRDRLQELDAELDAESRTFLVNMADYRRRVEVLRRVDFIQGPDRGVLTMKGRINCELRSLSRHDGATLVLTELLMNNTLVHLSSAELAAIVSGFVFQGKCDLVSTEDLPVHLVEAMREVREISLEVFKMEAEISGKEEYSIIFVNNTSQYITSLLDPVEQVKNCLNFDLCTAVYEWAKGMSFLDITKLTSVEEGTIVRCITQLFEALRDLRNAARVMGNFDLSEKFELACKLIQRDIVFAASLYY
ncbi:adenosinetriphosphatase [Fonticula alba]|uniref:Adenosinetriphosphatase n=1 Tax=Fonticula alba TaxID=691883 RepID=A0A058Z078_FONAL|nr:adenosinetriphosphatase [Fonticula alba]KCV67674.1 adenosinetriphosphatase [Fonticula alba]|eukprot:XP_009497858.1 adenosinetriphosphatase [Fonticula alba]